MLVGKRGKGSLKPNAACSSTQRQRQQLCLPAAAPQDGASAGGLAQLLVRDNAMVFSMEHVRLIIMHDKASRASDAWLSGVLYS